MTRVIAQIGPADHGKRMSLEEFEHAEGVDGHLYELSKGVIVVTDVPGEEHFAAVDITRNLLAVYRWKYPGLIYRVGGGSDCKILMPTDESERHPDLSVYLSAPVRDDDREVWAAWVPDVAIEIVSRSSRHRDYVEKREEYLRFGVREYWIIDADKEQMLALRRSGGQWAEQIVTADQIYRTALLPELELAMKPIFDAARSAR